MILDKDAVRQLSESIVSLIDNPEAREDLSARISRMAMRDADDKIVDLIVKAVGNDR